MSSTPKTNGKAKGVAAFSEALSDVIRLIGTTHTDEAMTFADWFALGELYAGRKNKASLSPRQIAMCDIINTAIDGAFGDDRSLKRVIAHHFAGNIAFVNLEYLEPEEGEEPMTKRVCIRADDDVGEDDDTEE